MTLIRSAESFGEFRVTYSVTTEESCACGDYADHGYLSWLGTPEDDYYNSRWDLRDLTDRFTGYRAEGDGAKVPSWITIVAESDFFTSRFWQQFAGDDALSASVSIHRPSWITDASWLRVCRLLGWRDRY